MLLSDLQDAYDAYLTEENRAASTRQVYLWAARAFALDLAKMVTPPRVEHVTPLSVRGYLARYRAEKEPNSARSLYFALRAYCRFLVAQGYLAADPMAEEKPPEGAEPHIYVPTTAQVQDLLCAAERMPSPYRGALARAAAALSIYAGLRRSDIVNLRLRDVDLEHKCLRVCKRKGGKMTRIDICEECVDALRVYLRERPQDCVHDLFLARNAQAGIGFGMLYNLLSDLAAIAGYRGNKALKRPHSLRHNYCNRLLDAGAPLPIVSQYMGHVSIDETLKDYYRASDSACRRVADMASLFTSPAPTPIPEPAKVPSNLPPARRRIPARRT